MDTELTIEELAERARVSVRTVRYYISEGILPPAGSRGKNSTYGEEHLTKLLLARLLADRRVLLADIRDQVSRLTAAEARELLRREKAHEDTPHDAAPQSARDLVSRLLEQARQGPTARARASQESPAVGQDGTLRFAPTHPAPPATTWRHIELAPGVELHIRSDAETAEASLIRRLVRLSKSR